jgi:hypothetical protein
MVGEALEGLAGAEGPEALEAAALEEAAWAAKLKFNPVVVVVVVVV